MDRRKLNDAEVSDESIRYLEDASDVSDELAKLDRAFTLGSYLKWYLPNPGRNGVRLMELVMVKNRILIEVGARADANLNFRNPDKNNCYLCVSGFWLLRWSFFFDENSDIRLLAVSPKAGV